MKKYYPVIGLEIHVELATKSKMFCGCLADHFGKKANIQTCPVCLGLPGALPVPNKKAVQWTILLAKALNCRINKMSKFDRKHYFYPDLPKGYQISQYDEPIGVKGSLSFFDHQNKDLTKNIKTFAINRVHLEEDTAKLSHSPKESLIDFNRSGVPLVEIVTEAVFHNSDDVKKFLEELRILIRYLGISKANMEKGSMRLEPNISLSTEKNGKELPKYKVEVKNINSFRFVKLAIEYEIKRQTKLLEEGKMPKQETRGFDDKKKITFSQRLKEEAQDYRYFPEPDIPPMLFSDTFLKSIFSTLPALPNEKIIEYVTKLGIKHQDAFILTRKRSLAEYFEKVVAKIKKNKFTDKEKENLPQFVANLIINKKISTAFSVGESAKKIVSLIKNKKGEEKIAESLIIGILEKNKKAITDYKNGKENVLMFLLGQVMKETKGKGNPEEIRRKLKKCIKKV